MRRHPFKAVVVAFLATVCVCALVPTVAVALDDGADWFETGLMPPTHDFPGVPRALPFMDGGTLAPTSVGTTLSTDVYRFHLNVGDTIQVSARGYTGSGSIGLQLYMADASDSCATDAGSVTGVYTNGKTARLTYTAAEDGCYRVVVRNLLGGNTTMAYTVAASMSNDGDNDAGHARSVAVPFLVKDFVDSLTVPQLPAGDDDDCLGVTLQQGHTYTLVFSRQPGSVADLLLFTPGASSPVALTARGDGRETVVYTAPATGSYALDVRARAGSAGRYALLVTEGRVQCSLTILKSTSAVRWGTPFILWGDLVNGKVGDLVIVWVKKPGKRYWSYSSNRLCYTTSSAGAVWWYRYVPRGRTSPRGTYYFKASYPGDATRSGAATPNQVVVTVR